MYFSIVIKLILGMAGVLLFLRMTGKTQMARLTPLDTVNTIVLGALVGSIIYMPDTRIWVLAFAMVVWFVLNILVRLLLRINRFNRLVHGQPDYLIKEGKINLKLLKRNNLGIDQFRAKLRERGIYSLFDVDEVIFETDGKFTFIKKHREGEGSYLVVSNGEISEKIVAECGHDTAWLKQQLTALGYGEVEKVFCAEYTPGRGFYVIDMQGNIRNDEKTGSAHRTQRRKGRRQRKRTPAAQQGQ